MKFNKFLHKTFEHFVFTTYFQLLIHLSQVQKITIKSLPQKPRVKKYFLFHESFLKQFQHILLIQLLLLLQDAIQ